MEGWLVCVSFLVRETLAGGWEKGVSEWVSNGLVEEEGLADVFDLRNGAFQVEGFGQNYFEDLAGGSQWGGSCLEFLEGSSLAG